MVSRGTAPCSHSNEYDTFSRRTSPHIAGIVAVVRVNTGGKMRHIVIAAMGSAEPTYAPKKVSICRVEITCEAISATLLAKVSYSTRRR